jgi:hypothetical protein
VAGEVEEDAAVFPYVAGEPVFEVGFEVGLGGAAADEGLDVAFGSRHPSRCSYLWYNPQSEVSHGDVV